MLEIESSLRLQYLGAKSEIEAAQALHQWDEEKQLNALSETQTELIALIREEDEDFDSYHRAVTTQLICKKQAGILKHYSGEVPVQTALDHYASRMFLWDTELIVEVLAKLGNRKIVDWAARSLYKLTEGMRESDGFIPGMQYLDHNKGMPIGGRIERRTFKNKKGSDYTQPFLLPTATEAVFEAYERLGESKAAREFLEDMQPRVKKHLSYFMNVRASSPDNPLVFNLHPHEDGRDNIAKKYPERDGDNTPIIKDYWAVVKDIGDTFLKSVRLRLVDWDPEKGRHIYGRRDVMFNALIVKDTLVLERLTRILARNEPDSKKKAIYGQDIKDFRDYAKRLEQAIYDHTWHEDGTWNPKGNRTYKGLFRSLEGNGEPDQEIDAGDLMALLLPNLSARQLKAIVNLILTSHNSNYGISGRPTDSKIADFHYQRRTGCSWDDIWPLIQKIAGDDGLRMQAHRIASDPKFRAEFESQFEAEQTMFMCNLIADEAAERSKELTKDVYAEMYAPDTGEPHRYPHVSHFGMSMQADIFNYIGLAQNENYFHSHRNLRRIGKLATVYRIDPWGWEKLEEEAVAA